MAKTSIEIQAEKNARGVLKEARLKQNIKEHNIKAAQKADKADTPYEERSTLEKLVGTKRHFKLAKEGKKIKKTREFFDNTEDRLDRGDSSLLVKSEKRKLEKKLPSTEGSFKGGGIAQRGLGRAFMKGGKV